MPINVNLHPLSVYWWQEKSINHKIFEQAGQQVIMLEDSSHRADIERDYRAYINGDLALNLEKKDRPSSLYSIFQVLSHSPYTLLLIILSCIGFLLVEFQLNYWVDLFRIQLIDNSQLSRALNLSDRISPAEFLDHGQYWRLVTPIFLHFGWVHLVFNMLWLWELGRRLERQFGAVHLLSVVFFIAVLSNLYQAASTPYAFFGGMSGVIYGLLGYCGVFNLINPHKAFVLPPSVYILMLLSLVIGWLGLFEFLARMANTAHLSGLLWGCFIAVPSALLSRFLDKKAEAA